MVLDRNELEKRFNLTTSLSSHDVTLGKLFPATHPDSLIMWRLAIIRDDIAWEFDCQAMAISDGVRTIENGDELWQWAYFMRRMTVSVLEAKRLFDGGTFTKKLKRQARTRPDRAKAYKNMCVISEKLNSLATILEPIRNSLGAHVDIDSAGPKGASPFGTRGLSTHAGTRARIHLNHNAKSYGTSFRDLTKVSFMFAWPDVSDGESLREKASSFVKPLAESANHLLRSIDSILYLFWLDIGAIEMAKWP